MILIMFLHKNKPRAPALQNNMQLLPHHDDWLTSLNTDYTIAETFTLKKMIMKNVDCL